MSGESERRQVRLPKIGFELFEIGKYNLPQENMENCLMEKNPFPQRARLLVEISNMKAIMYEMLHVNGKSQLHE